MNTPASFNIRVALGLLAACAFFNVTLAEETLLPDLGDRESSVLSPYQEKKLGDQILKLVRRTVPTVKDPILKYFVRKNLFELAEHSDLNTSVLVPIIVDSEDLNAFAAPGGIIGINSGLLTFAQDIHEYSSVVSHELAHLSQRHFARRKEEAEQLNLRHSLGWLVSAAIFAIGGTDPGLAAALVNTEMNERLGFKYSRHQEHEADRIGLDTLTDAGYDPMGAVRMFVRMKEHYKYDSAITESNEFLRTHPLTDDRISDLRAYARSEERQTWRSLEYQLMRVRVAHDSFDSANAALAHANSLTGEELHEKYDLALALVLGDEKARAVELMEDVYSAQPNSIVVIACYADLLVQADQSEQALEIVDAALANTPNNQPLSLIKVEALRKLTRYEEATSILQRIVRQSSEDVDLWFELEEVAGLAQNIFEVHRARAEQYALKGLYAEAIENLQLAKKNNDDESSILEARLNQRILELREAAEVDSWLTESR